MRSTPASEPDPNSQVQHAICSFVAREMLKSPAALMEFSPPSPHHFSFTFSIRAHSPEGTRHLFIKIPKEDLRGRPLDILPITEIERGMATEEAASLRLMREDWPGDDLGVHWVRLRGMIPEMNALVIDRVFADAGFKVCRRLDLSRRLGFGRCARRLHLIMSRLGTSLGRFHASKAEPAMLLVGELLPKLEKYCSRISRVSGSEWPESALRLLRLLRHIRLESFRVRTLKGLDVRNLLIGTQDELHLLDPGKTKLSHREADLARFLMTYRILYWGSLLLPFARTPDSHGEAAFLSSYYDASRPAAPAPLACYLLKEQLKHWDTALDSLGRRPWPSWTKRLVAAFYVNPFYERQIEAQIRTIGALGLA